MHGRKIAARDGLTLVSYLSLPPEADSDGDGVPDRPLPLILLVHGGPWGRDTFFFEPYHQWLANRGYAVLSVNFRSSTGFGKGFLNAGNLEWGRKMQTDLLDAVEWAVEAGVTARDSVCIMGGSYGGYAVLVGLAMTPSVFRCGVEIVGVSNLITFMETVPPYWGAIYEQFAHRMGDPRTEEGRALLRERSPALFVHQIAAPLLIGQGANDARVNQRESDQVVEAMRQGGVPVTYVLYPDEGHGFRRPENALSFNAVTDGFLAECLGGAAEPVGDDFRGSSIQVLEGAGLVAGLPEALAATRPAPVAAG
jgi:dipeptidyl aminopeptidase/acylaminoacyl peptidase